MQSESVYEARPELYDRIYSFEDYAGEAARLRNMLHAEGVPDAALERLHAPIGLDLGARTPEETAISICAEIIATRTGKTAPSLKDSAGPIHA